MKLEGRVAVVTGAANGIGRATALALAAAGADVVLADVDEPGMASTAELVRRTGRRCLAVRTDVAVREEVEALAARAFAEMGTVHVLVNNAGVAAAGWAHEIPPEHWRWVVDVNLWGPIHGVQAFVPRLVAAGQGGHVVNVASLAGLVGAPLLAPYCAAKAGVVALSEVLRMELRHHGIGVSVVCPGLVATGIFQRGRGTAVSSDDFVRKHGVPPERIARLVVKAIRGDRAYALTPLARLAWWAKRLCPALVNRASGRLGLTLGGKMR